MSHDDAIPGVKAIMKVLGLDTSTSGCSTAVWVDGSTIAKRAEPMARGQAQALVPMADEVMAEAGLDYTGLDRIAVTVGPGAFTGLRISLAAARGFALAANVPVVGITTFEAVAHGLPEGERAGCRAVLVAVDSRRAEPFLQLFDATLSPLGEAAMPDPAVIGDWLTARLAALPDIARGDLLIAGDGVELVRPILQDFANIRYASGNGVPDAETVAVLAAARSDVSISGVEPEPFYIRPPDVSLPKSAQPRDPSAQTKS